MQILRIVAPLLVLLLAIGYADAARFEFKHSFRAPFYLIRGTTIPFWDFGGNAIITEDYVRLTPALQSKAGWIWNRRASDMTAWEVEMQFQIHEGGNLGADGLAFWYTDKTLEAGDVFGSSNQWTGLGIFFDTFDNDRDGRNPSVVVVHNNGNIVYDGETDGRYQALGSCTYALRSQDYKISSKITYTNNRISVQMKREDNSDTWTECVKDLPVTLPTGYFFGMSADTGGLFDAHDIYSFRTTNLMDDEAIAQKRRQGSGGVNIEKRNPEQETAQDPMGEPVENNQIKKEQIEDTLKKMEAEAGSNTKIKELLERLKKIQPEMKQQVTHGDHSEPVLVMPVVKADESDPVVKEDLVPLFQQINQLLERQEENWQNILNIESTLDEDFDEQETVATLFSESFAELLETLQTIRQETGVFIQAQMNGVLGQKEGNEIMAELRKLSTIISTVQATTGRCAKAQQLTSMQTAVNQLKQAVEQGGSSGSDWSVWAIIAVVQVLVVIVLAMIFGRSSPSARRGLPM